MQHNISPTNKSSQCLQSPHYLKNKMKFLNIEIMTVYFENKHACIRFNNKTVQFITMDEDGIITATFLLTNSYTPLLCVVYVFYNRNINLPKYVRKILLMCQ